MTYDDDDTRPTILLSPDHPPARPLLGSGATRPSLARLATGHPPPGDGSPPILAPINPQVTPIAPDMAFQILDVRNSSTCSTDAELEAIRDAVAGGTAGMFSNADIRVACRQTEGENARTTIGLWAIQPYDDEIAAGRDAGLAATDLLREGAGETFGIAVTVSLINRVVAGAWQDQPKRLDHDGNADDDGPVHLTGFDMDYFEPDTVVFSVRGYDATPVPNVRFTATYTDTIALEGAFGVGCTSEDSLETDTGWHAFLSVLFAAVPTPLGRAISLAFAGQAILAETADAQPLPLTPGCAVTRNVLTDHLLLPPDPAQPTGTRINLLYERAGVNPVGIFAGGAYLPSPRAPDVAILGKRQFVARPNASTIGGEYEIFTTDLVAPVGVAWSGAATFAPPTARRTTVIFEIGEVAPFTPVIREIGVTVTDPDGVTAEATATVEIFVPDFEDETMPPICYFKPWLPQCQ